MKNNSNILFLIISIKRSSHQRVLNCKRTASTHRFNKIIVQKNHPCPYVLRYVHSDLSFPQKTK